uniref:Uncharacterized protein n=1 Tax=Rhizophora mucronata TaxID=61149 RepID=A0A2P2NCL8_RHIMU
MLFVAKGIKQKV